MSHRCESVEISEKCGGFTLSGDEKHRLNRTAKCTNKTLECNTAAKTKVATVSRLCKDFDGVPAV